MPPAAPDQVPAASSSKTRFWIVRAGVEAPSVRSVTSLQRPRESAAGLTSGEGEGGPGPGASVSPPGDHSGEGHGGARRPQAAPAHPPTMSPTAGMHIGGSTYEVRVVPAARAWLVVAMSWPAERVLVRQQSAEISSACAIQVARTRARWLGTRFDARFSLWGDHLVRRVGVKAPGEVLAHLPGVSRHSCKLGLANGGSR